MVRLQDKIALITGGESGIGLATRRAELVTLEVEVAAELLRGRERSAVRRGLGLLLDARLV